MLMSIPSLIFYAKNTMSLSQIKHVTSVNTRDENSKDGSFKKILEVYTDLESDATEQGYDQTSFNDIVGALHKKMKDCSDIDIGEIITDQSVNPGKRLTVRFSREDLDC